MKTMTTYTRILKDLKRLKLKNCLSPAVVVRQCLKEVHRTINKFHKLQTKWKVKQKLTTKDWIAQVRKKAKVTTNQLTRTLRLKLILEMKTKSNNLKKNVVTPLLKIRLKPSQEFLKGLSHERLILILVSCWFLHQKRWLRKAYLLPKQPNQEHQVCNYSNSKDSSAKNIQKSSTKSTTANWNLQPEKKLTSLSTQV